TISLGISGGVLTVMQARSISQVVDRVFLQDQSLTQLTSLLTIILVVILLRAVLLWGCEVSSNAIALRVKTSLREALFRHILDLGPTYARGESTGELTNVLVEGVEALDAYYSQYLPQLILSGAVPLVYLVFIIQVDLLSAVVLLLTAPLIPIFMVLIGNMAQARTVIQWKALSRMSAYFLDVLQGLTTLKQLGQSKSQVEVILQVSERYRQTTMSVLRITFLSALVLEMVATLSTAIVAVEIGLRLLYGRLSFEQALFVLLLAPEFYLPLRLLGTRFHAGMTGLAAAKRIFAILELPARTKGNLRSMTNEPGGGEAPPQSQYARFGGIQLDNVRFSYGRERPALNGVSFDIKPGHKIALVGPSGAGKSTIAAILMRFLDPTGGEIRVDGQELSAVNPAQWREKIAWISQNPYIFSGTVGENIRLARPNAGMEDVIQAAQQAYAHSFVIDLPEGYNSLIGERGQLLSAGQAQRIALARAFLKDAPLLIFDEPMANLDPETEILLQEGIDRLLADRTALIIAHRLNTTANANKIVVLDNGQVVEIGEHDELLARDGLYRRMITASTDSISRQAEWLSDSSRRSSVFSLTLGDQDRSDWLSSLTPDSWGDMPRHAPSILFTDYEDLDPQRESAIRIIHRLLKLIWPYKGQVAISVIMGFFTVLSGIGLISTSAYLISAAALQPSIAELQVAIVGVRFFGISRGIFRYLERLLSHQVTFHLLARMRAWFYERLEPLAPARLAAYHSGDLLTRIQNDIESLQSFYVRVLAPPLVAFLVAIVMGVFLYQFDRSLAIALLTFFVLVAVGVPILIYLLSRGPGRRLIDRRRVLNVLLVESIQGMADLLAAGQEASRIREVVLRSRELGQTQKRMAWVGGIQDSLGFLLANLCMWLVLVLAIPLVVGGQMESLYLAVVMLAALASFEATLPLPLAAQHMESNVNAAERLENVVNTEPEVQDPALSLPLPGDISLEVKNLSYRYPPRIRTVHQEGDQLNVLRDVSFSLPKAKTLAIVGPNGAGKSTLVNLLQRFWEYHHGTITLGRSDLRHHFQDDVRSAIGVVAQDGYLFNATVRENLLIARPKAVDADIVEAASKAQIHSFIISLPKGYDTTIGERGLQLSGGQRQRLLIARALLKDSPLLFLDEALANLDWITARQVMGMIKDLKRGRTEVIVTHRLVGLEDVDEILVLKDGRIIERGRHETLLERGGYYQRMYASQNQALIEDAL
ncbi:MAG: thiol reductant ABC exporter subunit CydD, partial [Anaerolineales bacterium]